MKLYHYYMLLNYNGTQSFKFNSTLIVNMLNIFLGVLPLAKEENWYLDCQHVELFLHVCFLWQGKRTSTLIVNMLNIFCVCASFGKGRKLVLWLSACWTFFVWVLPLAREDNCCLVIDLLQSSLHGGGSIESYAALNSWSSSQIHYCYLRHCCYWLLEIWSRTFGAPLLPSLKKQLWCNSTTCLVVDASPPSCVVATSWPIFGVPFL
jgi:hypothetical protein